MRRLILLVALAALARPAGAGTRVTVAQLDQALTAAIAAHKPDAEIARQIASLELSERLTEASLNRLNIRLAQDGFFSAQGQDAGGIHPALHPFAWDA